MAIPSLAFSFKTWLFSKDGCLLGAGNAQVKHHGHCHGFDKHVIWPCWKILLFDPLRLPQEPCHACLQSQHTNSHSFPSDDIPQGQDFFLFFVFFTSLLDELTLLESLLSTIEGVELNSTSENGDSVVARGLLLGLAVGLFLGLDLRARVVLREPGESLIRLREFLRFLLFPPLIIRVLALGHQAGWGYYHIQHTPDLKRRKSKQLCMQLL